MRLKVRRDSRQHSRPAMLGAPRKVLLAIHIMRWLAARVQLYQPGPALPQLQLLVSWSVITHTQLKRKHKKHASTVGLL